MNITHVPGKYIVAVSGGIDSVVLLHMMQENLGNELVVAHFNHGIREDSGDDALFVAGLANQYGLEFVHGSARLGANASEDTARQYRYAFLHKIRQQAGARAIVTAHHQDDVIETALMNVMRGTKRRGLVSLRSTNLIKRPLLHINKDQIREYAILHGLEWVEDSTNLEMKYRRNQVRALLHKKLTIEKRDKIVSLLHKIEGYNAQIDTQLNELLMNYDKSLPKRIIAQAEAPVAAEITAEWLRRNQAIFDKKTIDRIYGGAQKLRNGSKVDIDKHYYCLIAKDEIVLTRRESV